jgi:hypothetical protein
MVWTGLWSGLLVVVGLLVTAVFNESRKQDGLGFRETLTWVSARPVRRDENMPAHQKPKLLSAAVSLMLLWTLLHSILCPC